MENMEFKGTKGRWQLYHQIDDNEENQYSVTSDNGKVAYCYEMSIADHDNSTAKANAQLISKAPEMLEMLEKVLDVIAPEFPDDEQSNLIVSIKQLIKETTTI